MLQSSMDISFLTFAFALFEGTCGARHERCGVTGTVDQGLTTTPLVPEEMRDSTTASDLLEAWSVQSALHALVQAPRLLLLMVPGYKDFGAGPVQDRRPLSIFPCQVQVPQFCVLSSLRTRPRVDELGAAILHDGRSTQSGHYRVLLKQ